MAHLRPAPLSYILRALFVLQPEFFVIDGRDQAITDLARTRQSAKTQAHHQEDP